MLRRIAIGFMLALLVALPAVTPANKAMSGFGAPIKDATPSHPLLNPAVMRFLGREDRYKYYHPANYKYGDKNGNPVDTRKPLSSFSSSLQEEFDSVGIIQCRERDGSSYEGTGTIVGRRNVIITAAHALVDQEEDGSYKTNPDGSPKLSRYCMFLPGARDERGSIDHLVRLNKRYKEAQVFLGFMDPVDRSRGVPNFDRQNDWAVIKLKRRLPAEYGAMGFAPSLSESRMAGLRDKTYNVGYHHGKTGLSNKPSLTGPVVNIKMISKCRIFERKVGAALSKQKNILLHNCTTSAMSSGSGIYIKDDPSEEKYYFVGVHIAYQYRGNKKDGDPHSIYDNSGVAVPFSGKFFKRFKWACGC